MAGTALWDQLNRKFERIRWVAGVKEANMKKPVPPAAKQKKKKKISGMDVAGPRIRSRVKCAGSMCDPGEADCRDRRLRSCPL